MNHEEVRICETCQTRMSPIVVMDKLHHGLMKHSYAGSLEYRLPEDQLSFWTGKYPSAGQIEAFMCEGCGRIALFGRKSEA